MATTQKKKNALDDAKNILSGFVKNTSSADLGMALYGGTDPQKSVKEAGTGVSGLAGGVASIADKIKTTGRPTSTIMKEYSYSPESDTKGSSMPAAGGSGNNYLTQYLAALGEGGSTEYTDRYLKALGTGGSTEYTDRYLKALGTGGSDDYLTLALEALAKPQTPTYKAGTYESKYGSRLDALINDILASSYEGYDAASDPTYAAYQKQYLREADRTTEDVLGQYAALTGGMPSTAAVSAAAQAGNYYKGQLADKIPELEALAYQRYQNELEGKRANLSDLTQLENLNYGLWSDGEDRKLTEYEVNNQAAEEYLNRLVTAAELEQNKNSYDLDALYRAAGLEQDMNSDYLNRLGAAAELESSREESAYSRAMNLLSSGIVPSEDELSAAGIDLETANKLVRLASGNGSTGEISPSDWYNINENCMAYAKEGETTLKEYVAGLYERGWISEDEANALYDLYFPSTESQATDTSVALNNPISLEGLDYGSQQKQAGLEALIDNTALGWGSIKGAVTGAGKNAANGTGDYLAWLKRNYLN